MQFLYGLLVLAVASRFGTAVTSCEDNPCQNGGICWHHGGAPLDGPEPTYTCICPDHFGGLNCEIKEPCRQCPQEETAICIETAKTAEGCLCLDEGLNPIDERDYEAVKRFFPGFPFPLKHKNDHGSRPFKPIVINEAILDDEAEHLGRRLRQMLNGPDMPINMDPPMSDPGVDNQDAAAPMRPKPKMPKKPKVDVSESEETPGSVASSSSESVESSPNLLLEALRELGMVPGKKPKPAGGKKPKPAGGKRPKVGRGSAESTEEGPDSSPEELGGRPANPKMKNIMKWLATREW